MTYAEDGQVKIVEEYGNGSVISRKKSGTDNLLSAVPTLATKAPTPASAAAPVSASNPPAGSAKANAAPKP